MFLHSANDRLYPISVDMESKLPVAEMISTGIFVLDVGIKGTPKTYRDRETDRRDLFAAIESSDVEKVCYCFIIFSYLLSFEHILGAHSTFLIKWHLLPIYFLFIGECYYSLVIPLPLR